MGSHCISNLLKSRNCAEVFPFVEQNCIPLSRTVPCEGLLNDMNLCGVRGDHFHLGAFDVSLLGWVSSWEDQLPFAVGLVVKGRRSLDDLAFGEWVHDDKAEFDLSFGKRVDEDPFVFRLRKDPVEEAAFLQCFRIQTAINKFSKILRELFLYCASKKIYIWYYPSYFLYLP